ncbi:MAG: hypothetical protein ABSH36_00465 [Solirubrobacteraceae bacterium]
MSRPVPYTWKVGVDNAFGYLTRPDGQRHLAESRRFISTAGQSVGLAIGLDTGCALLTTADGRSSWQQIAAERACELVDIPAPEIDGFAEITRRLDPFHVERYTSPVFNAIVALAVENGLPCAHALRAWLTQVWDGTFDGPYLEQPETFAASVLERMAVAGLTAQDAVFAQLANDAALPANGPEHQGLAESTGWQAALVELPVRVSHQATELDSARQSRRQAQRANSTQLALI